MANELKQMKTLNGYELVDEQARERITVLENSGGGGSSGGSGGLYIARMEQSGNGCSSSVDGEAYILRANVTTSLPTNKFNIKFMQDFVELLKSYGAISAEYNGMSGRFFGQLTIMEVDAPGDYHLFFYYTAGTGTASISFSSSEMTSVECHEV